MKKIIYYIALSVMCLLPFSCSDMLEEENRTEMEKKNYMNTAAEAEKVLLGIYSTLSTDNLYGLNLSILFNTGTDMEQVEGTTIEGPRIVPTNAFPATQQEVQATWASLYTAIHNANEFLERISLKLDTYTETDRKLGIIYMAEARTLRGLLYFELVRRYGNVVLMTSSLDSYKDPSTFVQADPKTVYEFIEKDLKYAIDNLPYAIDDTYRTNTSYRISKGAALGLLAKVYATWAGWPLKDESKWELAAKTAEILIISGKHGLLQNYEQLWKNTCNGEWDPKESLIEFSFYSPTASAASDPVGRIGKWNGVKTTQIPGVRGRCSAMVKVIYTFLKDWREPEVESYQDGKTTRYRYKNGVLTDYRRDLSIANYQYTNEGSVLYVKGSATEDKIIVDKDLNPNLSQKEKQSYTPAKWDIEKYMTNGKVINDDKSNVNWYFLRYADVLLLYAEALNEWKGAPTDKAYEAVNMVRARGYGHPSSTKYKIAEGMDQEQFRETVRLERAYELAFEGQRRPDLVRWRMYYQAIQNTQDELTQWWTEARNSLGDKKDELNESGELKIPRTPNYTVARYTQENKHELLPIPQRDMDLCSLFVQNPGWKVD